MTAALVALIVAALAFFLGLVAGGMARCAKDADEALAMTVRPLGDGLVLETDQEFTPGMVSFDNLGQVRIDGHAVYSLTLYGDGSGDYTLSHRRRENDLTSYGGTA